MCRQNPRDINEAVEWFHVSLVRFLHYLTGDWDDAEDLAQDVWERIWRGKHVFDPSRGSYLTWLRWLARQRAFVHARAGRSRPQAPLDDEASGPVDEKAADPFLAVVRRDTAERVQRAILRLPSPYRVVVCLHYVEGVDCTEIARTLDCPLGTVHSRLHAARRRLRDSLDGSDLSA